MSGSVNKVILVGHLGADPEIKSFSNGSRIAHFSLATNEHWTDRASGERRERTEWHNVVINGDGLVGVAERYLRKGKLVYVEGKLRTRKWQDQGGTDRYTTEVVLSGPGAVLTMLDSNGAGAGRHDYSGYAGEGDETRGQRSGGAGRAASTGSGQAFDDGLDDDEIPF